MKYVLFFFLSLSIYAQDTITAAKSVIALDKMNVVYRGIANPISIAVNNAKSYKVYGNGVKKDENGNYFLSPGAGLTTKVYVEITKIDDTVVVEEHEFRIISLNVPVATINDEYSTNGIIVLNKESLKDAIISLKLIDFNFEFKPKDILSFRVSYNNKIVNVIGNKINYEAYNLIKKANKNSLIIISDIKYPHSPESLPKKVAPILIKVDN